MSVVDHRLPPARGTLLRGNLLGMSSMMIWAMSFPAAEILLVNWDPLAITLLRLLLTVGALVPIWIALDGWRRVKQAPWLRAILVGGPTFGLGPLLVLVSQDLTDAVTAAILAATLPIISTLIELVAGERRISLFFVAGLALSVLGAIVATGSVEVVSLGWGALAMLGSVVAFALGSFFAIRAIPNVSPMGHSVLPLFGGLVFVTLVATIAQLFGYQVMPTHQITNEEIGALLVFSLVGMAISQVLWIGAVGKIGVALASFHVNATPFYVMLFMFSLGHLWNWQQAFGASIVILGVVVAQMRRRVGR